MLKTACIGGEGKGQLVGIQCLVIPVEPLVQLAVLAVTQQGMTGVGELGTDLVGTAGDQLAFHQGQAVFGYQSFVIGLAGLCTCLRGVGDKDPVLFGILEKVTLQAAVSGLRCAFHNGQIPLVQLPVLDLLVHDPQGFCGLGGDNDAAGIPVDSVAQGGCEGVFLPGPPFPLLIQVGLDVVDEGPAVFRTVMGMNGKSGPLIHQQDVFVLVDDVQLGRCYCQVGIVLPGLVEKLVVDVQLQHIAGI